MKHYLVLTSLGLILAGCSTTYEVPRHGRAPEFLEAQEDVNGESADVELVAGQTIKLDSISLHHDKLVGLEQGTGSRVELPLNEVHEIAVTSVERGVGRGALQGMAIFGGTSLLLCAIAVAGQDEHDFFKLDASGVALFTAAGAASGFIYGAAYGALGFSTYHYEIKASDQIHQEPAQGEKQPRMITIKLTSVQVETSDQVCIMWSGRFVWLPRSQVTIQRDGDYILLTVPEKLLGET